MIIHYSNTAYELYKNNPLVLFENTIYTKNEDINKISCFDTAHYYFINKTLPTVNDFWKCVHLNGLDKDSFENNVEKHAIPGKKNDIIFIEDDFIRECL